MEDGRTRPDGTVKVVVVARDAARQVQYEGSLRVAGTAALATADPDVGADLLVQRRPAVLVLDSGLPRLALFRLYGLARQDDGPTPIQVVFVGQDDDTGPDDHYLPGDPSPSRVAVQVSTLISRLDEETPAASADDAPTAIAATQTAPPASQPERAAPPPETAARAETTATAAGVTASTEPPVGQASGPTVRAAEPPAVEATPATVAPVKPRRRLDVMLVRIGLVLLVLGGLLFLIQVQQSQGPLITPTLAPAAPTRRPSPSPSPGRAANDDAPAALLVTLVLASHA